MLVPKRSFAVSMSGLIPMLAGLPAMAQAPRPWEMNMQPAFSPMKQEIIDLHNLVLGDFDNDHHVVQRPRCWPGSACAIMKNVTPPRARQAITPAWKSPGP